MLSEEKKTGKQGNNFDPFPIKQYIKSETMYRKKKNALKSFYMVTRPGLNELHSVHMDGCPFLPAENKRIYLGKFLSLNDARHEGSKFFNNNCGCRFCTSEAAATDNKPVEIIENGLMNLQNTELLKYLN